MHVSMYICIIYFKSVKFKNSAYIYNIIANQNLLTDSVLVNQSLEWDLNIFYLKK